MTDFATDKRLNYPSSQPQQTIKPEDYEFTESELLAAGEKPASGTAIPAQTAAPQSTVNPDDYTFTESELLAAGEKPAGTSTPDNNQPSGEAPAGDPSGVVAGATSQQTGQDNVNTTQQTGQGEVKTDSPESKQPTGATPSNHLFDYGNKPLESIMASDNGKKIPKRQLLDDYFRWCQEKGQPIDYITINDIVNKSTDLGLSAEDDEKARKKAERKEKWDKVGNFLLHLGNAIGNIGGGGYASMKVEDPVQWSERQRVLKEKADERQRLNSQSIWTLIQKERAEQRAQEIAKQNAAHQAQMEKISLARQESQAKRDEAYIKSLEQAAKNKTELTASQVDLNSKKGEAAIINANKPKSSGRGRSGGKQNTTRHTTYTKTPPSRRANNNTPPSRRGTKQTKK